MTSHAGSTFFIQPNLWPRNSLDRMSVQLTNMKRRPAASLPVSTQQHQRTEATLAKHLVLALTTASMTTQLTSGGIIFDHACIGKLRTLEQLVGQY